MSNDKMVKYECSACKYRFERKDGFKGSLMRCPYCGKDGSVNVPKMANELLKDLID